MVWGVRLVILIGTYRTMMSCVTELGYVWWWNGIIAYTGKRRREVAIIRMKKTGKDRGVVEYL